eukprot:CAMPEP_0173256196 /NCGR_PEP_ID=MMETSP1142-20121109/23010_1 /TAXON_ID=483371 /ORGANISM="non described non described, Strain CCMP2298" /LENGTH=90 /DNA_ID=CAMNT_0014190047 /DNA_START=287 /DNA_END=555 /DNA_ORIENTATION=-
MQHAHSRGRGQHLVPYSGGQAEGAFLAVVAHGQEAPAVSEDLVQQLLLCVCVTAPQHSHHLLVVPSAGPRHHHQARVEVALLAPVAPLLV